MKKTTLSFILVAGLLLQPSFGLTAEEKEQIRGLNEIIRSLAPIDGQTIANRGIDLDIRFALGSAKLSSKAHHQLDELGKALTSETLAEARIGIYGHTDATGSAASNLKLSQQRAESVVAYLVKQFAINPERLEVKGFGEEQLKNPIASTAAENRRVEIVNLTPIPKPKPKQDTMKEDGRIQW